MKKFAITAALAALSLSAAGAAQAQSFNAGARVDVSAKVKVGKGKRHAKPGRITPAPRTRVKRAPTYRKPVVAAPPRGRVVKPAPRRTVARPAVRRPVMKRRAIKTQRSFQTTAAYRAELRYHRRQITSLDRLIRTARRPAVKRWYMQLKNQETVRHNRAVARLRVSYFARI